MIGERRQLVQRAVRQRQAIFGLRATLLLLLIAHLHALDHNDRRRHHVSLGQAAARTADADADTCAFHIGRGRAETEILVSVVGVVVVVWIAGLVVERGRVGWRRMIASIELDACQGLLGHLGSERVFALVRLEQLQLLLRRRRSRVTRFVQVHFLFVVVVAVIIIVVLVALVLFDHGVLVLKAVISGVVVIGDVARIALIDGQDVGAGGGHRRVVGEHRVLMVVVGNERVVERVATACSRCLASDTDSIRVSERKLDDKVARRIRGELVRATVAHARVSCRQDGT